MKLCFYANIRTVIGVPSLEIDDESVDTFRKVVACLIDGYPNASLHLLDENYELRKDVPVYVDGRNPRLLKDGIDTPLHGDVVVSFFSPISSGRMNVEVLREAALGKKE